MATVGLAAGQRYVDYPEASRYAGLSAMTLRRLIEAGKLHAYRPTRSRKVLLDRLELDALIQASAAPQAAQPGPAEDTKARPPADASVRVPDLPCLP
jgi:excisionase family DNA binding protein